jgi:hypothetical protein
MRSIASLGFVGAVVFAAWTIQACGSGDAGPAGATGPAGSQGATGPAGSSGASDPSFAQVVPRVGLLDRELDVTVTTSEQKLDATATVDFGAGVTVSMPQVVSDSTMIVHLAVDKAAATGAHDVKLTVGGTTLTGQGAFTVAAPLEVTPVAPQTSVSAAQGSLMLATLTNLDVQTAWDPNAFAVNGPGQLVESFTDVTSTNASAVILVDPLAPAGSTQLTAGNTASDGSYSTSYLSDPKATTVTAATPTTITTTTPLETENLAGVGATNFYAVSVTGPSIVNILVSPTGGTIQPAIYAYPKSGLSKDILTTPFADDPIFGPSAASNPAVAYPVTGTTAETDFFIVSDLDLGGGDAADYGYSVSVTVSPAPVPVAETSTAANSHDVQSTAQALTGNTVIVNGSLLATEDMDVYSFTAAVGDVWEFTYLESSATVAAVCPAAASGDAVDLADNVAAAIPLLQQHSASNAGNLAEITTAGTYYVAVLPQTTAGITATANYTFSLRKTN